MDPSSKKRNLKIGRLDKADVLLKREKERDVLLERLQNFGILSKPKKKKSSISVSPKIQILIDGDDITIIRHTKTAGSRKKQVSNYAYSGYYDSYGSYNMYDSYDLYGQYNTYGDYQSYSYDHSYISYNAYGYPDPYQVYGLSYNPYAYSNNIYGYYHGYGYENYNAYDDENYGVYDTTAYAYDDEYTSYAAYDDVKPSANDSFTPQTSSAETVTIRIKPDGEILVHKGPEAHNSARRAIRQFRQ